MANETIADIIAAMRDEAARADMEQGYSLDDAAEMMREFASRFEAAWKRELARVDAVIDEAVHGYPPEDINDRREIGDVAKLREALESCLDTICRIVWIDDPVYDEDGHYLGANYAAVSRDKARAALAAPPRNCDAHTADELKAIFKRELASELPIANEHEKNLVTITAMGVINTLFATATEKKGGNDADK